MNHAAALSGSEGYLRRNLHARLSGPEGAGDHEPPDHADLSKVARFTACQDTILGDVPILLGRTGYTGEDGFELFFPAARAVDVWEAV